MRIHFSEKSSLGKPSIRKFLALDNKLTSAHGDDDSNCMRGNTGVPCLPSIKPGYPLHFVPMLGDMWWIVRGGRHILGVYAQCLHSICTLLSY